MAAVAAAGERSGFRLSGGRAAVVCSADAYFIDEATGQYRFDRYRLRHAHASCWDQFVQALQPQTLGQHDGGSGGGGGGAGLVVLDNTNVSRHDYAAYTDAATAAGFQVLVEQFVCTDKAAALTSNHRSVHDVPPAATLAMLRRWEHDPAAVNVDWGTAVTVPPPWGPPSSVPSLQMTVNAARDRPAEPCVMEHVVGGKRSRQRRRRAESRGAEGGGCPLRKRAKDQQPLC